MQRTEDDIVCILVEEINDKTRIRIIFYDMSDYVLYVDIVEMSTPLFLSF